jgi:hypothetical protein
MTYTSCSERSRLALVAASPEVSQEDGSEVDRSESSRWIVRQVAWQRRLLELSRKAEKAIADGKPGIGRTNEEGRAERQIA